VTFLIEKEKFSKYKIKSRLYLSNLIWNKQNILFFSSSLKVVFSIYL